MILFSKFEKKLKYENNEIPNSLRGSLSCVEFLRSTKMQNESLGKSFYSLSFNFQKVSNSLTFSQSIKQSIKSIYLFITFQNLEFWDVTNLPPLK